MKDALGHGSNPGAHSGQIEKLPSKMTKAHFIALAQKLQAAHPGASATPEQLAAHSATVSAYADQLAMTNPRFDRQRFIEATAGKRIKMPSRQSSIDNAKAHLARVRQPKK